MTFKIYRSADGQYYFTATAANNEVILTSETYIRKTSAQHAVTVIKGHAASARVVDLT